MNAVDVAQLDGRIALVCSARDHRNPPAGRRGTIRVRQDTPGGPAVVAVELEFPQMFTTPAHRRTVVLTDEEIAGMLASEQYGAFTVTLADWLDPESPDTVDEP